MAITKVTNDLVNPDPTNASNLSSGSVPTAQLGNVDTSGITANKDDIALLGFKVAANGSLARYNLVDQSIDAFEDASGIDASASTYELRDATGKYYYGGTLVNPTTSGGSDATDGDYTVTTFTADGTYTTDTAQDYDVLVVGGGGSGGSNGGGGGGAGGFRYLTTFPVAAASFSVVVGDGGTSDNDNAEDSTFSTITAAGGGRGGQTQSGNAKDGTDGGSGGGASSSTGASGTVGAGNTPSTSPAQGFAGGLGYYPGGDITGGGGGGSSAVGGAASNDLGGTGGAGTSNSITGSAVIYAGGGGGGAHAPAGANGGPGGSGGGGAGVWAANPAPSGNPGTDALGGGGGGGGGLTNVTGGPGGSGGKGVVILRRITQSSSENDMVLVSNAITAESAPTTGDLVITYTDGIGTAVVNTDIKAYISRDGSAYTSAVTLASQGTTGGHTILTANGVDLSGITSGTSMRWKIETLNQSASKSTRIQAVSLGWS